MRANQYGTLPFDIPHRFLAYGEVKAPHEFTLMPALEIRSGFPFSFVNDRLDFVGVRNRARFPTNHFNPRDVQNNLGSSHFSQFFNSLGPSVQGKFEIGL